MAAHAVLQQFVLDELPRQEMSMSTKTGIWITAAMLLVAAVSGGAYAAESRTAAIGGVEQTRVRFGDLNVDRPEGAAVLYRRIERAAERVCGEPQLTGSYMTSPFWRSCVTQAVDHAVATVDRPALTAYYREHAASSRQKSLRWAAALTR
jgi:UrcA family protein